MLLKGVGETIQLKNKKQGFLGMLLGTLDGSLLGSILASRGTNRAAEGVIRAGYLNKIHDHDFRERPTM